MKLIELIKEAEKSGKAIGHFNFCNFEILKGIALASKETNTPVIVALSEGERKYLGAEMAKVMFESLKKETGAELFLSADHTKTLEGAKEVIDLGYEMIVADGSAMAFEDNISFVKDVIHYAKEKGVEIVVEGEIGSIGQSSEILDSLPVDLSDLTTPEEAKEFVEKTEVPILSPAIGNIHGVLKNKTNPEINLERIKEIKKEAGVYLTLHGASGISPAEIQGSVSAGINVVHFNSDLRIAFKEALKGAVLEKDIAPYKYLNKAVDAVKEVVKYKLSLLG